jgi:hypothetical protein
LIHCYHTHVAHAACLPLPCLLRQALESDTKVLAYEAGRKYQVRPAAAAAAANASFVAVAAVTAAATAAAAAAMQHDEPAAAD